MGKEIISLYVLILVIMLTCFVINGHLEKIEKKVDRVLVIIEIF